jgi:chromosome segregation ATPase
MIQLLFAKEKEQDLTGCVGCQKKVQKVTAELKDAQRKNNELQDEVEQVRGELDNEKQTMAAMIADPQKAFQRVNTITDEIMQQNSEKPPTLVDGIAKLQTTLVAYRQNENAILNKNKELKHNNLQLTQQVAEQQEKIKNINDRVQMISSENARLNSAFAMSEQAVKLYEEQVRLYQDKVSHLKSRSELLNAEIAKLMKAKDTLSTAGKQEYENKLANLTTQIQQLTATNNVLDAQLQSALQELGNAQNQHKVVQQEFDSYKQQTQQQYEQIKTERQQIIDQLSAEQSSKHILHNQLTTAQRELAEQKKAMDEITAQSKVLNANLQSVQNDLQSTLKQLTQIHELQTVVAELEKKALEQDTSITVLNKEKAQLEQKIQELTRQRNTMQSNIAELQQKKDEYVIKIQSTTEMCEQLQQQLSDATNQLKESYSIITSLETQLTKLATEVQLIADQANSAKRQQQAEQAEHMQLKKQLQHTEDELQNLNTELAANKRKIADLRAALQTNNNTLNTSDQLMQQQQDLMQEQQRILQTQTEEQKQLANALQQKNTELQKITKQYQNDKRTLQARQSEYQEHLKRMTQLETENNSLKQTLLIQQQELQTSLQKQNELANQLQQLTDTITQLQRDSDEALRLQNVEASYTQQKQNALKESQDVVQSLKKQIQGYVTNIDQLRIQLTELSSQNNTSEQKKQQLHTTISGLEQELAELRTKYTEETVNVKQLKKTIADLKHSLEQRQFKEEKMQMEIELLEKEISLNDQYMDELDQLVATTQKKNLQIEQEINNQQAIIEVVQQENQELNASIERLSEQLEISEQTHAATLTALQQLEQQQNDVCNTFETFNTTVHIVTQQLESDQQQINELLENAQAYQDNIALLEQKRLNMQKQLDEHANKQIATSTYIERLTNNLQIAEENYKTTDAALQAAMQSTEANEQHIKLLEDQIGNHQQQIQQYSDLLQQAQQNSTEQNSVIDSLHATLKQTYQQYKEHVRRHQTEIQILTNDSNTLYNELYKLTQLFSQQNTYLEQNVKQIDILQQSNSTLQSQLQQLHDAKTEKEKQLTEQYNAVLAQHTAEINALREQLITTEQSLSDHSDASKIQINSMLAENDNLRHRITTLQTQIDALELERDQMRIGERQLLPQIQQYIPEAHALLDEIATLHQTIDNLEAAYYDHLATIHQLQKDLATTQIEVHTLNEQSQNKTEIIKQLEQKLQTLNERYVDLNSKYKQQGKQFNKNVATYNTLIGLEAQLLEIERSFKTKKATYKSQIATLAKQVQQQQTVIDQYAATIAQHDATILTLQTEMQDCYTQVEQLNTMLDTLAEDLNISRPTNDLEIHNVLQTVCSQLDVLASEMNAKEYELNTYKQMYSEQTQQLNILKEQARLYVQKEQQQLNTLSALYNEMHKLQQQLNENTDKLNPSIQQLIQENQQLKQSADDVYGSLSNATALYTKIEQHIMQNGALDVHTQKDLMKQLSKIRKTNEKLTTDIKQLYELLDNPIQTHVQNEKHLAINNQRITELLADVEKAVQYCNSFETGLKTAFHKNSTSTSSFETKPDYSATIDALIQQWNVLSKFIAQHANRTHTAHSRIVALTKENTELRNANVKLQSEHDKYQKLAERYIDKTNRLNTLFTQLKQQQQQYTSELQQHMQDFTHNKKHNKYQSNIIEQLKKKFIELNNNIDVVHHELTQLQSMIAKQSVKNTSRLDKLIHAVRNIGTSVAPDNTIQNLELLQQITEHTASLNKQLDERLNNTYEYNIEILAALDQLANTNNSKYIEGIQQIQNLLSDERLSVLLSGIQTAIHNLSTVVTDNQNNSAVLEVTQKILDHLTSNADKLNANLDIYNTDTINTMKSNTQQIADQLSTSQTVLTEKLNSITEHTARSTADIVRTSERVANNTNKIYNTQVNLADNMLALADITAASMQSIAATNQTVQQVLELVLSEINKSKQQLEHNSNVNHAIDVTSLQALLQLYTGYDTLVKQVDDLQAAHTLLIKHTNNQHQEVIAAIQKQSLHVPAVQPNTTNVQPDIALQIPNTDAITEQMNSVSKDIKDISTQVSDAASSIAHTSHDVKKAVSEIQSISRDIAADMQQQSQNTIHQFSATIGANNEQLSKNTQVLADVTQQIQQLQPDIHSIVDIAQQTLEIQPAMLNELALRVKEDLASSSEKLIKAVNRVLDTSSNNNLNTTHTLNSKLDVIVQNDSNILNSTSEVNGKLETLTQEMHRLHEVLGVIAASNTANAANDIAPIVQSNIHTLQNDQLHTRLDTLNNEIKVAIQELKSSINDQINAKQTEHTNTQTQSIAAQLQQHATLLRNSKQVARLLNDATKQMLCINTHNSAQLDDISAANKEIQNTTTAINSTMHTEFDKVHTGLQILPVISTDVQELKSLTNSLQPDVQTLRTAMERLQTDVGSLLEMSRVTTLAQQSTLAITDTATAANIPNVTIPVTTVPVEITARLEQLNTSISDLRNNLDIRDNTKNTQLDREIQQQYIDVKTGLQNLRDLVNDIKTNNNTPIIDLTTHIRENDKLMHKTLDELQQQMTTATAQVVSACSADNVVATLDVIAEQADIHNRQLTEGIATVHAAIHTNTNSVDTLSSHIHNNDAKLETLLSTSARKDDIIQNSNKLDTLLNSVAQRDDLMQTTRAVIEQTEQMELLNKSLTKQSDATRELVSDQIQLVIKTIKQLNSDDETREHKRDNTIVKEIYELQKLMVKIYEYNTMQRSNYTGNVENVNVDNKLSGINTDITAKINSANTELSSKLNRIENTINELHRKPASTEQLQIPEINKLVRGQERIMDILEELSNIKRKDQTMYEERMYDQQKMYDQQQSDKAGDIAVITELTSQIAATQAQLAVRDDKITELTSENNELKISNNELATRTTEQQKKLNAIEDEFMNYKVNNHILEQNSQTEQLIGELQSQKERLVQENLLLQQDTVRLTTELQAAKLVPAQGTASSNTEDKLKITNMQATIAAHKRLYKQQSEQIKSLEADIKTLRTGGTAAKLKWLAKIIMITLLVAIIAVIITPMDYESNNNYNDVEANMWNNLNPRVPMTITVVQDILQKENQNLTQTYSLNDKNPFDIGVRRTAAQHTKLLNLIKISEFIDKVITAIFTLGQLNNANMTHYTALFINHIYVLIFSKISGLGYLIYPIEIVQIAVAKLGMLIYRSLFELNNDDN